MAQLIVGDASPLTSAQEQLAQVSMDEKPAAPVVTAAAAEPEPASVAAPPLPPGRPGTLTPEEEEKLRQLWALSARLFGFADEDDPAPAPPGTPPTNGGPPPGAPPISTPGTPSRSKRAMVSGWFRRRDDSPGSDAGSATPPPSGSTEGAATSAPTSGGWNAGTLAAVLDQSGDDKHGLAAQFRAALAQTTPQQLRDAFWDMVKHDHPDGILLRFLRARKWDVAAAQVMAVSALHWRAAHSMVDSDVMLKGEMGMLDLANSEDANKQFGKDFMEQIRLGKSFLRGVDKLGRPCCYIRVRLHHAGDQSEASLERFTVYVIETARLMLKPPVDTAVRLLLFGD
jgi:hypothetical protein